MIEITYHKSELIPGDSTTVVFWMEQGDGAQDILEGDIPEGAKVIDETHQHQT